MKVYKADFHIHTVLSPCADLLMTPGNIIKRALEIGLDIIAITDHNTAGNLEVALKLTKKTPLYIIPGMEVESSEEVHLLCLFPELNKLLEWERIVYQSLPVLKNDEEFFGYQLKTDLNDEFIAKEERLLATATNLSINNIVQEVKKLGGLVIPSHIDRPHNSIIANLGFIPSELDFPFLELSKSKQPTDLPATILNRGEYSFIKSSDSHYLEDIKPMVELIMKDISLDEIVMAVCNLEGRKGRLI